MAVSMQLRILLLGASLLAAVFAGGAALAADGSPKLELNVSAEKEVVTVKDGKEVVERVPSDKAGPGDVLVYTISYTNAGTGEAKDASIVDPVPEGTDYVVGSAEGAGSEITCSIDGGKSYHAQPVKRVVKRPDGTTEEVDADPGMYTHVRWVVKSVPAGESGELSFKVQLE